MKQVVFWQKVPKPVQKDEHGQRFTEFELVPCQAEVLAESEKVCGICGDPERVHGKPKRRHGFSNPVVGLSLKVTYVGNPGAGQTVKIQNVQQGKKANCWTEEK
jgi:hypothetical protein